MILVFFAAQHHFHEQNSWTSARSKGYTEAFDE
jgi:hypothetical protein